MCVGYQFGFIIFFMIDQLSNKYLKNFATNSNNFVSINFKIRIVFKRDGIPKVLDGPVYMKCIVFKYFNSNTHHFSHICIVYLDTLNIYFIN